MNTPSEEPILHEQVTKLAELEQAQARLREELTHAHAERAPAAEEQTSPQTRTRSRRSSRRKMLEKGLGVAAATVGAGALLELSSGTTLAAKAPGPGVFASSVSGTPAVKATGTNGADGVDASSDSGTGLVATSSSGLAAHFVGGNVNMDKNLTVTGALSTGTLSSGTRTFASNDISTPPVRATGTNFATAIVATTSSFTTIVGSCSGNGNGVVGESNGGIGVEGESNSGIGVRGNSNYGDGVLGRAFNGNAIHGWIPSGTGLAGFFEGNVQVNGNFAATGTKAFVQAHPTDPSREIVYVALEGGEAGTYMRGTGQLQSGKAVLALPEHFGLVTATEGLTIQLTPRGEWLHLYLVELDTAQLVVREAQGKSGAFDYLIHGVRRGYEQHEVLRMKR